MEEKKDWNPRKTTAPEFRGIGLSYEQFNQMQQMMLNTAKLVKWQVASSIVLSVLILASFFIILYLLNLTDTNNFLSRLVNAVEVMAAK